MKGRGKGDDTNCLMMGTGVRVRWYYIVLMVCGCVVCFPARGESVASGWRWFPPLLSHLAPALPVSAFNCLAPNLTLAFFSLRYESIMVDYVNPVRVP